MAVKTDSNSEDAKSLIKKQNCETHGVKTNKHEDNNKNTVSDIPLSAVTPAASEVKSLKSRNMPGKPHIINSTKVVIGNKIYFNGPVNVKRIRQKVPAIKSSSRKNEDNLQIPQNIKQDHIEASTFDSRRWHIISFGVLFSFVFIGIISILFNINLHNHHRNSSNNHHEYIETGYAKLWRLCSENSKCISIIIALTPLAVLLKSMLRFSFRDNKNKIDEEDIEEVYDIFMRPAKEVTKPVITPEGLRLVSRTVWGPEPVVYPLERIRQPVPWVIISHTATGGGNTQSECIRHLRVIQKYHKDSQDWDDIGYNFLVGGDGSAYCGRGWDNIGAHTRFFNKYSIGISFIGTFVHIPPPKKQLEACKKLLKRGVAIGKLAKDYKLFAHKQLWATLSPGEKLYDIIKEWPHFVKNINDVSELIPDY